MISLAAYIEFIRNDMGVTADQLPDTSSYLSMSYNAAVGQVNRFILQVDPDLYAIAVYNLAAHYLVMWGPSSVFDSVRQALGLNNFTAGVISASSDESTSQSRLVPDFFKNLSLSDLSALKDPWGRVYLDIAQQFSSQWGLN